MQAIAPVRETAAQALGVAARPLPDEAIFKLADHLEKLTHHNNWNVQHAGLLGIKYLLVARSDLQETLLSRLMPALLQGLKVIGQYLLNIMSLLFDVSPRYYLFAHWKSTLEAEPFFFWVLTDEVKAAFMHFDPALRMHWLNLICLPPTLDQADGTQIYHAIMGVLCD